MLAEAVTIDGVELRPANPKTGGPILVTYGGTTARYRVTVNTLFYDGPVGITSIWKRDTGEYRILDNTGKQFGFDHTDIADIIRHVKQQADTITVSKTGAAVTLTRIA